MPLAGQPIATARLNLGEAGQPSRVNVQAGIQLVDRMVDANFLSLRSGDEGEQWRVRSQDYPKLRTADYCACPQFSGYATDRAFDVGWFEVHHFRLPFCGKSGKLGIFQMRRDSVRFECMGCQ